MQRKIYVIVLLCACLGIKAQVDRSIRPVSKKMPAIKIPKTQNFSLKNGLKIIVLEDHKLPKISMGLILDNPIGLEKKTGTMEILSEVLGNETKSMKKEILQENIDFMGSSLNFSSGGFDASFLSRYLPEMMDIISDIMFKSVFSKEELEKEKSKTIEYLKAYPKDIDAIGSRLKNVLLYGKSHPYGVYITKKSIKSIQLKDLKKAFAERYNPKNAYLWVKGDVNFKEMKTLLKKHFGKWQAKPIKKVKYPKVPKITKTSIAFVDMPEAVQSSIAAIRTVHLKRKSPDYFAAILANYILGGGGNSRLFLNLREDKGYTYGSYSKVSPDFQNLGSFSAFAKVRNAVTDSATVELIKEIHLISQKPVSEEELDIAKSKYIGNFIMGAKKKTIDFILNTDRFDLPKNYYKNFIKNFQSVTVKDVQRAAQKYFQPNHLKILILGKASEVLKGLEKLPYPMLYYDKQGNPTSKSKISKM